MRRLSFVIIFKILQVKFTEVYYKSIGFFGHTSPLKIRLTLPTFLMGNRVGMEGRLDVTVLSSLHEQEHTVNIDSIV